MSLKSPIHILVTGGSQGIGYAIARRFAAQGTNFHLHLIGRNEETIRKAALSLPSVESQQHHSYIVGDVSKLEFWKGLNFAKQESGSGGINALQVPTPTVLINAAGISIPTLLVRQKPEDIEQIIQTNLMGTIWACRYTSKAMIAQRSRSVVNLPVSPNIINISSLLGLQGGRGTAAYSASKAGVIGLTRSLAAELGPLNIRVNTLVPGYITTAMTSEMSSDLQASLRDRIPLQRFGTSEEVADAALFLATNNYANNCVLNLDGGLSAVGV